MQLNKKHTTKKAEESSSLKKQELLFIRRPDLDAKDRLALAIAGLGKSYRRGTISDYEARYNVSHTFIYNQSKKLKEQASYIFGMPSREKRSELEEVLSSIRFFLEGKLETKSPLYGLSNLGSSLGIKYTSISFISEVLQIAGGLLAPTYTSSSPLLVTFLCDEVYSGGDAILVTLEAQSMMVIDIRLVKQSLASRDWEASFADLEQGQVMPTKVIKDQGHQMASAVKVLPDCTVIGADTFHAIPHRLGVFHNRLTKKVQSAVANEANRAARFISTKTYPTALKKEAEWEKAKLNTLQAIDHLEWFEEYYFKMIQQLRPFTSKGEAREKVRAEAVIRESIQALSLLSIPNLQKQLDHIEGLLDNGQLLHFMDQVPLLHQQLQGSLEASTSWLWMLYWQWNKKSYQTHSPKVQQRAKAEALAAQQLLQEHYQHSNTQHSAQKGQSSSFEVIHKKVFSTLDQIVQASSLVETFNSILKPFINSARGQLSQELLNLVQFYHNHRVFQRGKRQNYAPIELLTGQKLQKNWIDLLMYKIQAAFEQYQVNSVKKLKELIRSKIPAKTPAKTPAKKVDLIPGHPLIALQKAA